MRDVTSGRSAAISHPIALVSGTIGAAWLVRVARDEARKLGAVRRVRDVRPLATILTNTDVFPTAATAQLTTAKPSRRA